MQTTVNQLGDYIPKVIPQEMVTVLKVLRIRFRKRQKSPMLKVAML